MDNYIGQYRIMIERDLRTNEPLESTYIKCNKGGQIYRYNKDILVYSVPRKLSRNNVKEKLNSIDKNIEFIDWYNTSEETIIKFYEKDLSMLEDIFQPSIKGKDIKPKNKHKSIDKNKIVTEENRRLMAERLGKNQ